jgi:GT2 family glycosyltransferase
VIIPVSAVIATRNRAESLSRTLDSLLVQGVMPAEFIVVDASEDDASKKVVTRFAERATSSVRVQWFSSGVPGAASQRTQGVTHATQPVIWFFDDDILFEPDCVHRLWNAIESDRRLGGVNAMIVNQRYQTPGAISRFMFTLMHGQAEETFAGKVIGPAINLLPEDRADLPEVVPVEWLNTTCTMYRREALPDPPFPDRFTGYSLMEDVTLSLKVAQAGWRLANARTARIFHDSQGGIHKSSWRALSCMELTNRYFVMREVLRRRSLTDHAKLALWESFSLASLLTGHDVFRRLPPVLAGKRDGICQILSQK